jgi:hypothetical protein
MQLYGSLVGMFELNNLALAVPAPVARYKDLLLHPVESGVDVDAAAAALQEVQPLLDALGDDADAPAEVRLHTWHAHVAPCWIARSCDMSQGGQLLCKPFLLICRGPRALTWRFLSMHFFCALIQAAAADR